VAPVSEEAGSIEVVPDAGVEIATRARYVPAYDPIPTSAVTAKAATILALRMRFEAARPERGAAVRASSGMPMAMIPTGQCRKIRAAT
jgi:hypothetical protein